MGAMMVKTILNNQMAPECSTTTRGKRNQRPRCQSVDQSFCERSLLNLSISLCAVSLSTLAGSQESCSGP